MNIKPNEDGLYRFADLMAAYEGKDSKSYGFGEYTLFIFTDPNHKNAFWSQCIAQGECYSDDPCDGFCDECLVNRVFNSTAYFDGVRHLEFNREGLDMAGYVYYPNMENLIAAMQKLREIELEVCRDCER